MKSGMGETNAEIGLQQIDSANATLLQNIAPDVFDNAIEAAYLKQFLDDPRHFLIVALCENTVIGMGSAFEYFHPDKPPQLFINEIGVAPDYRQRGIGRRLVESLIEVAEKRGCVYAWLGTEADNVSGNACFSSVPEVEDPQPFLLYEWELDE